MKFISLFPVALFCFLERIEGFVSSSTRLSMDTRPTPFRCNHNEMGVQIRARTTELQVTPLLTALSSPTGAFSLLAFIVLVHECGHYVSAKYFKIKVEEFSVGFGPRILGFQAFGDDFNLRLLPLGGYVRFPENYNATEAREQQREAYKAYKEPRSDSTLTKKKTLGYFLLNAVTFGALEDQRRDQAENQNLKAVKEWDELPFWKKIGTQKPIVNQKKEDFEPEEIEIEYYDDPDLLQNRPWQQRAVVLSAGVVFNLLLSFSVYFGEIAFGSGLPQPVFEQGAVVSAAPGQYAPANGILRQGDTIVAINGNQLRLSSTSTPLQAQKSINGLIAQIRATPPGESLQLSVMHPNDKNVEDVTIEPKPVIYDNGATGPQSIGVLLKPNFVRNEIVKSDSPIEAAALAAKSVSALTRDTAQGLLSFVQDSVSGKGSSSQVSGPIGLIKTGSDIVRTQDWTSVLLFVAAISVNLGVVNAFPLPALDGGQLVFVLAEAITRRKVNQRVQESITGATILLLLLVSLSAAVGDIQNVFAR